jgi:aminoglycoside 2''-phosphotransferase
MFRFPRWPSAARTLGREVSLLEFLADRLSARIPAPILVGVMEEPRGWPFMAYEKLPGNPLGSLRSLTRSERLHLTAFLIRLFSELADCPKAPLERIGLPSGDRRNWDARFGSLRRRFERSAQGRVPRRTQRQVLEWFKEFHNSLADSHYRPVLLHGDLWPSHILRDPTTHQPNGVIDWEDSRFGDPAYDLCTFGDLGEEHFAKLIEGRRAPSDPGFEKRLGFYRRILPIHGLVFGLESGRPSVFRSNLKQLEAEIRLTA